ncbi:MAG: GNAT family N-acetyltransferase [Candidatus Omnitrophota bacterium]
MEKISQAKAEDYEEIQRLLEDAYGHTHNYFSAAYPAVWRKETTDFQHTYLIREGDGIASLVRVFSLDLILGKSRVKAGGIGGVATSPSIRGKGYMSQLMNHAIDQMKEEGFPVSILGGDRHRYRSFGYENAGKTLRLTVTRRGLDKAGIKPIFPQRYFGEPDLLRQIIIAYQQHPYRRKRAEEEYRLIYRKSGLLLFCSGKDQDFGYLALSGEGGREGVVEFGGNAGTILGITRYVMERFGDTPLTFFFPERSAVPEPILKSASDWNVVSTWMLKIIDLEKTISVFLPQTGGSAKPDLAALKFLPEPAQVEALFGTLSGSPFNFFLWPLDCI